MSFSGGWTFTPSRPVETPGSTASEVIRHGKMKKSTSKAVDNPEDDDEDEDVENMSAGGNNVPPPPTVPPHSSWLVTATMCQKGADITR